MNLTAILVVGAVVLAAVVFLTPGTRAEPSLDAKTLAQLAKAGSDLKKPHVIEFFFYFRTEEDAQAAATPLRTLGLTVVVQRAAKPSKGAEWVILGKKTLVPSEAELQKLTLQFNQITKAHGGDYDGWGAQVVK